ncbi:Uncharacterized protein APZ42_029965 [Daphnia magna]|uniref:Uncharacterized protein n=1 Tax=Daphnia magna TaxID=35525 RepID=A0A164P6U3_9CRUS|nr:Uncharacterized protein APZ42_029965 [Daphnia magna]
MVNVLKSRREVVLKIQLYQPNFQIAHHIPAGWSNPKPPLLILKHHETN